MIHRLLKYAIPLSLFLFPACSQDEEPGVARQSMEFSVSISEHPQTRVSDNTNGMGSTWSNGDVIFVQVTQGATSSSTNCTLNASGKITAYSPTLYWKDGAGASSVLAWYSNITGYNSTATSTINFSDQSKGLAYVLRASASANPGEQIALSFSHQLAKVRVKVTGDGAADVNTVKINNYQTCNVMNGYAQPGTAGYITTMKNGEYFEANVVPTNNAPDDLISFGDDFTVEVSGIYKLEAGKVYTITIDTKGKVVDSVIDIQGHTAVKMRDEDGDTQALWVADRNIGADSESSPGLYFWWGDVVGHTPDEKFVFYDAGLPTGSIATGLLDPQGLFDEGFTTSADKATATLLPKYDAATQKWGSKWRLPTTEDLEYLIENCEWKFIYGSGYKATAPNGNYIILPYTGNFLDRYLDNETTDGYYWSANLNEESKKSQTYVSVLSIYNNNQRVSRLRQYYGICIRPVSNN